MALSAAAAGTLTIGDDLVVNRLGFGAMRITGPGVTGPPTDRDGVLRVLRRAVELDVNLIDTADSYGPNVSEDLIAEALHPYPEALVLATKGGLTRPPGHHGEWPRNGRPEHLRAACEGSLRRLAVERIDLYQLHRVDPDVPLAESVGALAELRDEGKIRHIGLSNVSVAQLEEARGIVAIVSVQNRLNLTERTSTDVLDVCERDGLAFFPWHPLAAGKLAEPGGIVAEIAASRDASAGQVALAWLLARSPVMVPIPGTSSPAHLEENIAATELELTGDELRELEDAA